MQKIRLFFILLIAPLSLLAQQRTKIILQHADTYRSLDKGVTSNLRNPTFRHANAVLTCDSAVFFSDRNAFEAFNNVHIVQGDTINIYSDHLYYDGNTKIAHLTNNVRMVDKESTLTTNILDYNMGTKVGTYVAGGKLITKDVTLTSQNGYYFSNSRDAYFRYNVLVVSKQSTIKSDTLRYNTLTNWAYFYGPTNILGKDDKLYTENGAYNTKTEYAYFGKKNLYTNGAKSLKGDSLYYDGVAGYGKAVRNIVFRDTTDKTVLYGQLGFYYKKDERALVTKNAYVGMGTKDSVTVNKKLVPDSIWMGADTLETQMVLQKTLKLIESPVLKKDNELGEEEKPAPKSSSSKPGTGPAKGKALPLPSGSKAPRKLSEKDLKGTISKKKLADSLDLKIPKDSLLKDSAQKDSQVRARDSLTLKILKDSVQKDSLQKNSVVKAAAVQVKKDTITQKKPDSATVKPLVKPGVKTVLKDSLLKNPALKDTVLFSPADTIKTRAIRAYHHVRVFKSNMQAVADSLFYTSADSTLRWYGNPILWSQGSQQVGDTIYLRIKNNKLNTLQVLENGFLVNVYADSAKYNQVKGKLITAFFKDGQMSNMFVDGNAESIYYMRDKDSVYTDMSQTVSARIKILFQNKEISQLMTIKDPEGVRIPVKELKEEKRLSGFTWKPELRPLSKKEVIMGKAKSKPAGTKQKPSTVKKITVKNGKALETLLKKEGLNTGAVPLPDLKVDSLKNLALPLIKKADSLLKKDLPIPLKKK